MLYFDTAPAIEMLSDADCGKLFKAMLRYAMSGELPAFSGLLGMAWTFIQPKIDADGRRFCNSVAQKRYAVYVREQKRSGADYMSFEEFKLSSGDIENYRPINPIIEENSSMEFDNPIPIPTPTPTPIPTSKVEKRQRDFSPPSVEEVKAYCSERHNGIDAQRFHDFYSANGWVQGRGKPVKDWRACVRTWEGKDDAQQTAAPQTSTTDAIKARREREQAATHTADELIEWPQRSGLYCLRSQVEEVGNGRA